MTTMLTQNRLSGFLDRYVGSQVPGLQYIVVEAETTLFEYAGGWADIQNRKPMTLDTTMMGYSMTKPFTAVAILQLVEQKKLGLDQEMDRYLSGVPYAGHHISIRQLLTHSSGIPNPIPLRWAHLAHEETSFDEESALAQVLQDNPKLAFEPGQKFAYSNIGYWLLGKIVEQVSGRSYPDYLRTNVIELLGLSQGELDFTIHDPARHANGYLAKFSLTNLLKGFVTSKKFWGGYEGNWLRLRSHYLNGPSFGGLVGMAGSFACFLQDQLRTESVLIGQETKKLFETQQTDRVGKPIPMTLGWHIREKSSTSYFFKEGGGGGFRSEMRIYPVEGIGSVVMANSTTFHSTNFLNRVDAAFLEP